jgi:HEPN domain-containing protein
LPKRTDSGNPADWVDIAESDLSLVRLGADHEVGYGAVRSKLAEVLEKTLKAELIRIGWALERTHDLRKLASELQVRQSDLQAIIRPLVVALAEVYFADRYPGFDLDDPDWPGLREQIGRVEGLLALVKSRVTGT